MKSSKELSQAFKIDFELIYPFSDDPDSIYLYGGAIRDYLLDSPIIADYDFIGNFDINQIYEKNKTNVLGFWPDVATVKLFITGSIYDITHSSNPLSTLKTHDITISNLAIDSNGKLYDVVDGLKDLEQGLIRIKDPEQKIKIDPSRIIRVARMKILLNFEIEQNTSDACSKYFDLIDLSECPYELSLIKSLNSGQKEQFIKLINQIGENHANRTGSSDIARTIVKGIFSSILPEGLS